MSGKRDRRYRAPEGTEKLLRVSTGYFVAGAVFRKLNGVWICVQAAPIMKWMRGQHANSVHLELLKMGADYTWHPVHNQWQPTG